MCLSRRRIQNRRSGLDRRLSAPLENGSSTTFDEYDSVRSRSRGGQRTRLAGPGFAFNPPRAPVDGAAGIFSVVPFVRRACYPRTLKGADCTFHEPRPPLDHRYRTQAAGRDTAYVKVSPLLPDDHFSVDGHVMPHVAAKKINSTIDGRTTRYPGYAVSQKRRKQVEEAFGSGKTIGLIRTTVLPGLEHALAQFTLSMAAYNFSKRRTCWWSASEC
jgi:hypothetical protein